MNVIVLLVVGAVAVFALTRKTTVMASIVTQADANEEHLRPSGVAPLIRPPQFAIETCQSIHSCVAVSSIPIVVPSSASTPPAASNSQADIINSTTGQNLTAAGAVDAVPPIGKQPANMSAWVNVFSSPGVWRWSLISDPSVFFMADVSGHRIS